MIFITVGTHEQPFNRLVEEIDYLVNNGEIKERVVIQNGYSTYIPQSCEWSSLYSYSEMASFMKDASIIVTHGGPSTFMMALQCGKIPIVVPRQKKFSEHINDHQVEFVKIISERYNNIIPIYNISDLNRIISEYNIIVNKMNGNKISHNKQFISELKKIINDCFEVSN